MASRNVFCNCKTHFSLDVDLLLLSRYVPEDEAGYWCDTAASDRCTFSTPVALVCYCASANTEIALKIRLSFDGLVTGLVIFKVVIAPICSCVSGRNQLTNTKFTRHITKIMKSGYAAANWEVAFMTYVISEGVNILTSPPRPPRMHHYHAIFWFRIQEARNNYWTNWEVIIGCSLSKGVLNQK